MRQYSYHISGSAYITHRRLRRCLSLLRWQQLFSSPRVSVQLLINIYVVKNLVKSRKIFKVESYVDVLTFKTVRSHKAKIPTRLIVNIFDLPNHSLSLLVTAPGKREPMLNWRLEYYNWSSYAWESTKLKSFGPGSIYRSSITLLVRSEWSYWFCISHYIYFYLIYLIHRSDSHSFRPWSQ